MFSRNTDQSFVHASQDELIDRDVALRRVLELAVPLAPASMTLREANGLWLAAEVEALVSTPAFDQSAMDGFALRSSEVAFASESDPVLLPVSQMIAAGDAAGAELAPGTVARIMTGASVPNGADTVLEFELAEIDDATSNVIIRVNAASGRNVRRVGEQVLAGSIVSKAGDTLTPALAGLLASVGIDCVLARRRPRVAVVVTGAEIVAAGELRAQGQVYDALTPLVDGYIRAIGGEPVLYVQAPDDAEALQQLLERIAQDERPDLILTTAGISAGDRDAVRFALDRSDDVEFVRLRMKPGRPLALGRVGNIPFVGLPGNPLAATVSFLQFVSPLIRRLAGDLNFPSRKLFARAATELGTDPGCDRVLCGVLESDEEGRLLVTCVEDPRRQGLHSLAEANCLMIVPQGLKDIPRSTCVEVQLLPSAYIGRTPRHACS